MTTELGDLLTWIETHRWRLQPYIEGVDVEHRAIWGSEIMRNVTKAIKQGDPVAIDLGCSVIIADQKYPFGKIIKSNLSRALKRESRYITKTQRQG